MNVPPLRLLTAVPICDGHDSAINTINLEFIRHGIEVIYLGYHRPARDIVRAALQEDVRAVGLSSYNGGHLEFFAQVAAGLRERTGGAHIGLFGGGGGTITAEDAERMANEGTDRIFFAGTPLDEMIGWVKDRYAPPGPSRPDAPATGAAPPTTSPSPANSPSPRTPSPAPLAIPSASLPPRSPRPTAAASSASPAPAARGKPRSLTNSSSASCAPAPPPPASPSSRTTPASSAKARCSATAPR